NHQHSPGNLAWLHLFVVDFVNRLFDNGVRLLQTSHLPQQVETVGMEGFDLDKIRRVPDEFEQAFFKFSGGGTGEGQHQQLFVLDVFHQKQRSQFMNQNTCLSAARAGSNHDVLGFVVVDDF